MTDKEFNDKIKIQALLETYSAKDISAIFSSIDKKLMSLHKCSADDFLKLNDDFKLLFNQSKVISENVNSIFDIYNKKENSFLYNEIHQFYDQLKDQIEIFDNKIVVTMKFLEELSSKLRFIFFPIKNFAQNLMSLKYLIANLNLTISYNDRNVNLNNHETKINELKQLAERISKNLNHLRKITKISFSNFTQVKNQNKVNVEELLSIVKSRINLIEDKFNENKDCIPVIKKKTEKSADSISDIIKKLQYQDIIKQKMEHIQLTHKDILNELSEFENLSNDDKHLNEKAKFFLRIRDIAGLQAAQLIHANKEYQSAIEIIINNFMQIGDNMKVISEMCGKINENDNDSEVELLKEVLDQISMTENGLIAKFDQNKKLYKDVLLIDHQLTQSESYIDKFKELKTSLSNDMDEFFKIIKEIPISENKVEDAITQLQELFSEINTNGSKIEELAFSLEPIKNRIKGFISEHNSLTLNTDFSEIRKVASRLNEIRENVNKVLSDNYTISNTVLDNIKKSISDIKYYDYFEKMIVEIISELNTINYNLKDHETAKSKDDNLEQLKEYYTMESEHIIHDQVTEGKDAEIDIENEEDGEIEFF